MDLVGTDAKQLSKHLQGVQTREQQGKPTALTVWTVFIPPRKHFFWMFDLGSRSTTQGQHRASVGAQNMLPHLSSSKFYRTAYTKQNEALAHRTHTAHAEACVEKQHVMTDISRHRLPLSTPFAV